MPLAAHPFHQHSGLDVRRQWVSQNAESPASEIGGTHIGDDGLRSCQDDPLGVEIAVFSRHTLGDLVPSSIQAGRQETSLLDREPMSTQMADQ
jgi:hypothetical protein